MDQRINYQLIFAAFLVLGMWALEAKLRVLNEVSIAEKHEQWVACYQRVYKDGAENAMRLKIFQSNVEFIKCFNRAGTRPYKLAINQFADLTNEEFWASHNGFKSPSQPKAAKEASFRYENVTAAPAGLDWRKKGAVTGIKDQGQCGCCWAFSEVAAMQGIQKLKTGKLISLSEQELVDCDTNGKDQGCEGGLMDDAFEFIIGNKGLTTEANYPCEGNDGSCNKNKAASHAAPIKGYEDVPANSESALLKAVANQPVSVAIDAGGSAFQFY